jgi:CRISPR-associated endonuclease Cas1
MDKPLSWKIVTGHGAHIKASLHHLRISHQGVIEEIPLAGLDHLLLYGGHVLHTSALSHLLNTDVFISFYTTDGKLVGTVTPPSLSIHTDIRTAQQKRMEHPFDLAKQFAYAAMQQRIQTIEQYEQKYKTNPVSLLRAGEMDILYQTLHETEFLIKLDELRRVERLVHDMYYEIYARLFDPSLMFRRRTRGPYRDPVNAMLALGYSMLSSCVFASLQAAFLDPNEGILHSGNLGLVHDMAELHKAEMIDIPLISYLQTHPPSDQDVTWSSQRCSLSSRFVSHLTAQFSATIDKKRIDEHMQQFIASLTSNQLFIVK